MPHYSCTGWVVGTSTTAGMAIEAPSSTAALDLFFYKNRDVLIGDVHFSVQGKGVWIEGKQFIERGNDGEFHV